MSYITRNLKQTITYWGPGTPDGLGGNSYPSPVKIKGRWEDRTTLFTDRSGNEKRSSARVYVNQDVTLNGYLYLGNSTAADPTTVVDARLILDFRKVPNLRATEYERRVLL